MDRLHQPEPHLVHLLACKGHVILCMNDLPKVSSLPLSISKGQAQVQEAGSILKPQGSGLIPLTQFCTSAKAIAQMQMLFFLN